jgi:hypothetical protein
MIGLSLTSVSERNMWSCYDWVVVVAFRLLTQYLVVYDNDKSIIIRPHIVFTEGRQQRQPNHNTITYCGWGCRCLPSVNTICGDIMIGLSLLSSVSKHNMWSYYDWVLLTNDNPIIIPPNIVLTDGRQQRQPNHNTTTYCVYWRRHVLWLGCRCCRLSVNIQCCIYDHIVCLLTDGNNDNPIIIRPHIMLTDGRQQQ